MQSNNYSQCSGGSDESSSPIRSYQCSFCKRGFTTAQALGGHMNIHRRDRANKALMKPTASSKKCTNHAVHYFAAAASPSSSGFSVKSAREREQKQFAMDSGELDLELRLWPDSGSAADEHNDSYRLNNFFSS